LTFLFSIFAPMKTPHINIADYDYPLQEKNIAKYPLEKRDESKLLLYRKGDISHDRFKNIADFLPEGSFLVMNNSRVIHARLELYKTTGARIEIFCLEPVEPADFERNFESLQGVTWKCLVGNAKKWKTGILTKEIVADNRKTILTAEKLTQTDAHFYIRFSWDNDNISFADLIDVAGKIPIPPYLNRDAETIDTLRYQTIYAEQNGSVAAPTAGLHFTDTVFESLKQRQISWDYVTLHVSAGTFRPVKSDTIAGHTMHNEHFVVQRSFIEKLITQKFVVSVGTTSMRTLESIYWLGIQLAQGNKSLHIPQWFPYKHPSSLTVRESLSAILHYFDETKTSFLSASTEIIIVPSYTIRMIQGLITNFHQPKSTLLLLVAALVGDDKWKDLYDYALKNDFRFLSYGDSSLLIP